jgi:hypothetical protein
MSCKIFYGRHPSSDYPVTEVIQLDEYFVDYLIQTDYNLQKAVDYLICDFEDDRTYHTVNPLIINFMSDEYALEHVYILDENGAEIKIGEDEHIKWKLSIMGPGDAVIDDDRTFKD